MSEKDQDKGLRSIFTQVVHGRDETAEGKDKGKGNGGTTPPVEPKKTDAPATGTKPAITPAKGGWKSTDPLPRTWADDSLPIGRVILGLLFIAYSTVATTLKTPVVIGWFTIDLPTILALLIGAVLGVGIFIGQVLTAERHPRAYWTLMVPDTALTAWLNYDWMVWAFLRQPLLAPIIMAASLWIIFYAEGTRWWLGLIFTILGTVPIVLFALVPETIPLVVNVVIVSMVNGYMYARSGEAALFGRRRKSR